jgi:hypothetical protein
MVKAVLGRSPFAKGLSFDAEEFKLLVTLPGQVSADSEKTRTSGLRTKTPICKS